MADFNAYKHRPSIKGRWILSHTDCSPSAFMTTLAFSWAWSMTIAEKFQQDNLYNNISTLKLPSHLWMGFLEGQHISQMNGKPTCLVEIVVGEEVWNMSDKDIQQRTKLTSLNDRINASIVSSIARMRYQNWNCGHGLPRFRFSS